MTQVETLRQQQLAAHSRMLLAHAKLLSGEYKSREVFRGILGGERKLTESELAKLTYQEMESHYQIFMECSRALEDL